VIAESRNINNDAVRHSEALLELKKAQELAKQGSQSTDDLRALGVLSKSCSWCGFCFRSKLGHFTGTQNKGGSGVALYKLKLENEGEPARLAKYILKASTMSHAGKLFQLLCRPNFVSGCRG
jgi:hypothetical protein